MTLSQTDPHVTAWAATRPPTSAAGLPASTAVRFDAVSRRFGDVLALDHLDLAIATGETVALLGPNGAGKSTAIGLMLGLLEPTIRGRLDPRASRPGRRSPSGRIGSMLQQTGLPTNVRVGELVDFARRLYPAPVVAGRRSSSGPG